MARSVPSGTPDRPKHYLVPRHGRLVLFSLIAPAVILLAVLAVYFVGRRAVASPAPLVLRHAPVEATCEECHRSSFRHSVSDLRCERCHDPGVTGRLELDAHAAWIPPSHQVAARETDTCTSCHTDHLGRLASIRSVPTVECARCHEFSSLAQHPQFAIVQAAKSPAGGLQFSHARHMDEVRRTLGRGCEACHRLNADLSAFEPTSFDRHCAACHLKGGVLPVMTDPISETLVSSPPRGSGVIPAAYGVRRPGRGTIVVSGLAHRDPWIVENLQVLARGVYEQADVAERRALETRVEVLNRARTASLADAATADLQQRLRSTDTSTADPMHLRDRISLELERRATGAPSRTSLAAVLSDERAIESALAAARARLAALADRTSVPAVGPDERGRRLDAIVSLAGPCLTCHVLQRGIELAPVNVDARRLPRAQFTHAPHVIQVGCEECHSSIATSTAAADLNTPGIETCRKCHATGQAPFGCTVCHRYHASADAGFGRSAFGGK